MLGVLQLLLQFWYELTAQFIFIKMDVMKNSIMATFLFLFASGLSSKIGKYDKIAQSRILCYFTKMVMNQKVLGK
jgi:hypothetical protein